MDKNQELERFPANSYPLGPGWNVGLGVGVAQLHRDRFYGRDSKRHAATRELFLERRQNQL